MTLTSQTNRVQYSGNPPQIAFPITFVFWLDADIQAVHTDANGTETIWVVGAHFTLTGGSGSTGTLTVKTSPTDYTPKSGETLTITSNLDDTQDTSLPEGGPFPSSSVEQQLDKIVRLIQQKAEALGRSIKLKLSSTFTELTIPDPSASKFLRWNTAATALENADVTGSGSIGLPVSIADGGTNAITAAAARTSLAVPGTGVVNTFSATQSWANGADVASASPCVLGTDGNFFDVTGTTGFSAFTVAAGTLFMVQFDGALTLTHGASLDLPGEANITTAAGDRLIGFAEAANTVQVLSYSKADGSVLPRGYNAGCILSNDTDAAHDINVTAGEARQDDNTGDLVLATGQTKRIDASWATGNDAGGLSSSLTLADATWYHVHLFLVGTTVEIGFDTSITAANLIADHGGTAGKYRRLGSVLTFDSGGSNFDITQFTQIGEEFFWTAGVSDHNADPGASEVTTTLTVPTGVEVRANITVSMVTPGTQANYYTSIYHPNVTAPTPSAHPTVSCFVGPGLDQDRSSSVLYVRTNTSAQIQHISDAGVSTVLIVTTGWIDDRGRFD